MRACLNLHRFLTVFLPPQSKPRLKTLFAALDAVIRGERLTLTGMGRQLAGPAKVKHKIKAIHRLLARKDWEEQAPLFFKAIAAMLLQNDSLESKDDKPLLLVDWTAYGNNYWALVAAVRHDGRALPIYVEVHPKSTFGKPETESAFLDTLKATILPEDITPILVTDSGFRNPWFQKVREMGWHFVGRLTSYVKVQAHTATSDLWTEITVLHKCATTTPQSRGLYQIAKTNPVNMELIVFHGHYPRAASQKRGPSKGKSTMDFKYRRRSKEPWMLGCSLPEASPAQVVGWYAQRMQEEETFRDDKNAETGVGLDQSDSYQQTHLIALRLLGALVSFLTQLVGVVGEQLGLHRDYQANTVRDRRVLSLSFLGRQMLRHEDYRRFSKERLLAALEHIRTQTRASSIYWTAES